MGRHGEGAPSATALIAAAGAGERLGREGPKALVELAGRPMLEWSLRAFAEATGVDAAVVAALPGSEDSFRDTAKRSGGLEAEVVAGGPTRSESVAAALAALDEATELVAVHDAARPLVTAELVEALVAKLAARPDADGVIAATAVTDTVKRAGEPGSEDLMVEATESRDRLWAAQTPQVFRAEALRSALSADPGRVAAATDDASLIEEDGGTILIHPSPFENLKVTTALDLRVAELLLAERGSG